MDYVARTEVVVHGERVVEQQELVGQGHHQRREPGRAEPIGAQQSVQAAPPEAGRAQELSLLPTSSFIRF